MHDDLVPTLTAKITIPLQPHSLILRPRLISLLTEYVDGRLTIVCAPAGFGKSTALTQWAIQSAVPAGWLSLDEADNDPIRFLRATCVALERISPGAMADAMALCAMTPLPTVDAILASLLNMLRERTEPIALVLDDYHVITSPSIHAALASMIEHAPSTFHLIIASRDWPAIPLARLRTIVRVADVSERDLRFTHSEVADFYAYEAPHLRPEDVAPLATWTEGWGAALRMTALSARSSEEIERLRQRFPSSQHTLLGDYLREEVLVRLTPKVRDFLLKTSVCERLCDSLCEALIAEPSISSGARDGDAHSFSSSAEEDASVIALEQVARANLFLACVDEERQWYRYHHLFSTFLRHRLEVERPAIVRTLNLRAARWHAQHGYLTEAVDHAFAAGDLRYAIRLIRVAGRVLIGRGEVATVQHWLDTLPEQLARNDPHLCLLCAWIALVNGRRDDISFWLDAAEGLLSSTSTQTNRRLRLRGELSSLRAHHAAFGGDISTMRMSATRAMRLLPSKDGFLRGLTAIALGVACWLEEDLDTAAQAFGQALALGEESAAIYVRLMAACGVAQVSMVQGKRHLALRMGQRAVALATDGPGQYLPAAVYAFATMAQLHYERDELSEAEAYAQRAADSCKRSGDREGHVFSYTVAAQVAFARGEISRASELMERAAALVEGSSARSWIDTMMVGQQARLALAQGRLEIAEHWTGQAEQEYVGTFESLTRARIALARQQPLRTLELLALQVDSVKQTGRWGVLIEIYLLQALAQAQLANDRQALSLLHRALTLAEPEDFVRLFADEGRPMALLLEKWQARQHTMRSMYAASHRALVTTPSLAYVERLLSACLRSAAPVEMPADGPPNARSGEEHALLSEREKDILSAVGAGASNGEIATRLTIELSTVKWHLSNIYGKLGVRSRTQALIKARELHLLS